MTRRLVYLAGCLLLGCGVPQAEGPSFDCAKAVGEVQELICRDGELAALDRRLAEVYETTLDTWPAADLDALKAFQRGWVGGRDDCWKEDEVRPCVELSYRRRIAELRIQSGQLEVPTPVYYRCDGLEDTRVVATFYHETEPPTAVITVGGDQVFGFSEPTASGARYAADAASLWEHHGEAKLEWFGASYDCRARED